MSDSDMDSSDEKWEDMMWDRLPHMTKYSRTCLTWLDKYVALTFGLQKLHKEYSKGVAKLVKVQKEKTTDGRSLGRSWTSTIGFLGDLSEKHRQLASIFGEIGGKYQEEAEFLSTEHRTLEEKGRVHQFELDTSALMLEKTKDKFFQRQSDASKAEDALFRSEEDESLNEEEIKKLKSVADEKKAKYNKAREEYSHQLSETNRIQKEFFKDKWPSVLSGMKSIVDRSVESVISLLRRLDHLSKGDLGDLGMVADDLENTVEEDFYNFLNWVKSGNPPPQDYTFEETGISGKASAFGSLRKSISRASLRLSTTRVGSGFNSRMSLRSPAQNRSNFNNRCTSLRETSRRTIHRKPSIIQEDHEAIKDVLYKNDVSNDSLEQVREDQRHHLNQHQHDKSEVELVIREPNDPPTNKPSYLTAKKSASLSISSSTSSSNDNDKSADVSIASYNNTSTGNHKLEPSTKAVDEEKPKLNITVNPFEETEPMEETDDSTSKKFGVNETTPENKSDIKVGDRSVNGLSVDSYDDSLNPFTDNFEE